MVISAFSNVGVPSLSPLAMRQARSASSLLHIGDVDEDGTRSPPRHVIPPRWAVWMRAELDLHRRAIRGPSASVVVDEGHADEGEDRGGASTKEKRRGHRLGNRGSWPRILSAK